MFKIILRIACLFSIERVSIQREIATRIAKKRGNLDMESEQLLHIYDRLNSIVKNQVRKRPVGITEIAFLLRYPKSSLNLKNGKKISLNDLEIIRKNLNG